MSDDLVVAMMAIKRFCFAHNLPAPVSLNLIFEHGNTAAEFEMAMKRDFSLRSDYVQLDQKDFSGPPKVAGIALCTTTERATR